MAWFYWLVAFLAFCSVMSYLERRHIRRRIAERRNKDICAFVRALPYRELDTRVIRVVFEELQQYCYQWPIQPTDRLADFDLEDEEFEGFVSDRLVRNCGRSLENYQINPYYDRVTTTPEMLIRFLCAQPKLVS